MSEPEEAAASSGVWQRKTNRESSCCGCDSSSLQMEISETKKMTSSLQGEIEILRLQLQSAQAQLRQKERIIGYNSSSTLYVDLAHIHSNGSSSKGATPYQPRRPSVRLHHRRHF